MASDDLKMRQRDALIAQAMSAAQRIGLGTAYGNRPDALDPHANRSSSRASSIAALQSQLVQASLLRPDGAASDMQPNAMVGEQYLLFSLLERVFALQAQYIQGVERLVDVTPVPNVASWVRGVINLRGSIASVVDLRTFLALEPLPYNPPTRLLSVHYNEMVTCLVVDSVSEMTPIPPTAITDISLHQTNIPHWALPYASGYALLDKRAIVLLDAARLLFSDKMQRYSIEI